MLTKDTAICIRTVDYSETSQIVTFFAKAAGKITCIAKGSKRAKSAFDGTIEVFSHGKIVFADSDKEKLLTLTEFEQQPGFTNLAGDLFALNCALFAAELVNHLINEYDPHPELFDSFLQLLKDLHNQQNELALLILFQLSLLKEVGLQPILKACVNCKNNFSADWPATHFSSSANGLICRDCETNFSDKIRLSGAAANCLSNFKLIAESKEKTLDEIEKVLVYHFTELIGRSPKMAKHVMKS